MGVKQSCNNLGFQNAPPSRAILQLWPTKTEPHKLHHSYSSLAAKQQPCADQPDGVELNLVSNLTSTGPWSKLPPPTHHQLTSP